MKTALVIAALALSSCGHAQIPGEGADSLETAPQAPAWRAVNAETGKIRDIEELEQLARDFPDSGTVRLRMLQPLLAAGEVEKVMATLEWLYDRGYVFSEVAQAQIPKLLDGVDAGRVAERLVAEPQVIASSTVYDTVPADIGLAESVIRDPKDDRLIVSSVSERGVMARRAGQGWDGYWPEGAANISGLALDQERHIVWMASGNIDGSEEGAGFSGLIGLDHKSNSERRIAAPGGATVSDLAIGQDGTLYASDPLGGGVYSASPASEAMEVLISPGTLRSPQGLALSEDNARLYVSDYRYGIAIVDLATREVSRLAADIPVILDGVDGLWRHGNELIAMQNGTSPMRISAFQLSQDGTRAIGHRILEQANPAWTEPLGGSIDRDALIYVGNGQWSSYVQGELAEGKEALPVQIRHLPLPTE